MIVLGLMCLFVFLGFFGRFGLFPGSLPAKVEPQSEEAAVLVLFVFDALHRSHATHVPHTSLLA
jgi:hypothetical protein